MLKVLATDFVYWEINKALSNCQMELDVIYKLRVEQQRERFQSEQDLLRRQKSPGFDLNIKSLYHGSNINLAVICQEGPDRDQADKDTEYFGRGIYFSDSPERCRSLCEKRSSSDQKYCLLLCEVILGDCKQYRDGEMDPELLREPEKTKTTDGRNVYYDSVKGKIGAYDEYVVYERHRIHVQYIVQYKCTKPLPVLQTVIHAKQPHKKLSKSIPMQSPSLIYTGNTSGSDDDLPTVQRTPSLVPARIRNQNSASQHMCPDSLGCSITSEMNGGSSLRASFGLDEATIGLGGLTIVPGGGGLSVATASMMVGSGMIHNVPARNRTRRMILESNGSCSSLASSSVSPPVPAETSSLSTPPQLPFSLTPPLTMSTTPSSSPAIPSLSVPLMQNATGVDHLLQGFLEVVPDADIITARNYISTYPDLGSSLTAYFHDTCSN